MSGWEARLHVLGVVLIEGEDGPSVASVTDGGRAAASGQVSVGDVVLAVNDIRIDDKEPRDIERLGEAGLAGSLAGEIRQQDAAAFCHARYRFVGHDSARLDEKEAACLGSKVYPNSQPWPTRRFWRLGDPH